MSEQQFQKTVISSLKSIEQKMETGFEEIKEQLSAQDRQIRQGFDRLSDQMAKTADHEDRIRALELEQMAAKRSYHRAA